MTVIDYLITGYMFVLGLLFGSFFNVVGIRVPEKRTLLGRSHCPQCDHVLSWWELVPVLGYLVLKGKCKSCGKHISVKYPLMELATAGLFAFSFVILRENVVEYVLIVVFISLLVIVTVSDMYHRIVPDIVLLVSAPILLVLRIVSPVISWQSGLIGAVLGFGFMYLMALYGKKRFKTEALGGGDIKLYALIGLVLGFETVFLSILIAGVLGLIYALIARPQGKYIPFVPFIAMGALIAYFVGPLFNEWYVSIFL